MKLVNKTMEERARYFKYEYTMRKTFMEQVDKPTILSLVAVVKKHGHPSQAQGIEEFFERYSTGKLSPEDISFMNDMYNQYYDKVEEEQAE